MGEARAQPSTGRAAAGVFASEQPVRRAGRAWRLGPWRAFLLRLSRTAEVGVCGSVPAATATAAPPGCSDLRGELHALALGEEEGQGLVANLRRKRYLLIPPILRHARTYQELNFVTMHPHMLLIDSPILDDVR